MKKKKKFVVCLEGSFKLVIDIKDECNETFFTVVGHRFTHSRDGNDVGDLEININKNVTFTEKIFEVREMDCECMHLEELWMCKKHYEILKRDKYQADENSIIVYLKDLD